jgi:hypothetical protein
VGKRRDYTRLEKRATGERLGEGGRGLWGDVGHIDLVLHHAKTGDVT